MDTQIDHIVAAENAGRAAGMQTAQTLAPLQVQIDILEARVRVLRATVDMFEFDGGPCKELGNLRESLWNLTDAASELSFKLSNLPSYVQSLVFESEMAKIEGAAQ